MALTNYKIVNVRKGKGERERFIYAEVRDAVSNELCVTAELSYCANWIIENENKLTANDLLMLSMDT